MASANTKVSLSTNVRESALNINAKALAISETLAAVWHLAPTSNKSPSAAESFSLDMKNPETEWFIGGDDGRTLVDKAHFGPGGKYRSIVKLFMRYEFQKGKDWAMGTGWLVTPDILVTAGHCSYDWSHRLGRATEVKAYIGYDGEQSERDPTVQFRYVQKIVATGGWVTNKGLKPYDVSFMKLDRPFTDITPISFEDTPDAGDMDIGVVGYPGDLADSKTKEKGAHMYEMFQREEWNLVNQQDFMLEYHIDTFGGNSGSPVLRLNDLTSIGVHVYGGSLNSASVIGKYGNPYHDYLAAFNLPVPATGLNLIKVPKSKDIVSSVRRKEGAINTLSPPASVPGSATTNTFHPYRNANSRAKDESSRRLEPQQNNVNQKVLIDSHDSKAEEEGFVDALRKAASIGAPIVGKAVSAGLPFALGPIGAPVGAIAAFVLNAAGKLAESPEALLDSPTLNSRTLEGCMERAILAEATLTAIEGTQLDAEAEESLFGEMKDSVMKALPTVRKVAPRVMGAMMEPALRIALEYLHQYNNKGVSGAESFAALNAEPFEPLPYSEAIDYPAARDAERFLVHLQAAASQKAEALAIDGELEEGFGDFLKAAIRPIGRGLMAVAQDGLPLLLQHFSKTSQESAMDLHSTAQSQWISMDALAHRAIVAEAALQAVMKLPPGQLQEEGFLDGLLSTVRTIAPIALDHAKPILSNLVPSIGSVSSPQEPATFGQGIQNRPRLNGRRSLATLREAAASK